MTIAISAFDSREDTNVPEQSARITAVQTALNAVQTALAGLGAADLVQLAGVQIVKVAKVALAAVDTAGGIFAWQAPAACFVREILLDVTTPATGACTVDVGPAANGTTLNDTMLDGIDVHTAAATFSSRDATNGADTAAYTDAVLTFKKCAAGQWFTGSKASGASAGLVGNAYIHYTLV